MNWKLKKILEKIADEDQDQDASDGDGEPDGDGLPHNVFTLCLIFGECMYELARRCL